MTALLRITTEMTTEAIVRELMLPLADALENPEHRAEVQLALIRLCAILEGLDAALIAAEKTLQKAA